MNEYITDNQTEHYHQDKLHGLESLESSLHALIDSHSRLKREKSNLEQQNIELEQQNEKLHAKQQQIEHRIKLLIEKLNGIEV